MAEEFSDAERAILQARTRLLAAPPAPVVEAERLAVVTITVSGERYAVEAAVVHGVVAIEGITPLPHAPAHVAGLIAHAGAVLPAFHLGAVLDLPLGALPEHARALLVGERAVELALVVDGVGGFDEIDAASVSAPPSTVGAVTRAMLRGIDREGVPVVDGARLLRSERLYVDVPVPWGRPDDARGEA